MFLNIQPSACGANALTHCATAACFNYGQSCIFKNVKMDLITRTTSYFAQKLPFHNFNLRPRLTFLYNLSLQLSCKVYISKDNIQYIFNIVYSSLFLYCNVIYQFTCNQNFYVSFQRQVLIVIARFDFKNFTNELKEKGIQSYYRHEKQYCDIQSSILIVHDACILEYIF